jgi:hypothetical protein
MHCSVARDKAVYYGDGGGGRLLVLDRIRSPLLLPGARVVVRESGGDLGGVAPPARLALLLLELPPRALQRRL